jgi:Na+-transporting NADH:ubiquinone oxidoreductase subunit NqrB
MTTQGMMRDVLIALVPVVLVALYVFRGLALFQIALCVATCLAAEALFVKMRGRQAAATLADCSAAVTGVILALSLPATAPWYVGVIAGFVAIGIGKVIFGGLGMNLFNPAMVGRAFVMISFAGALAASGAASGSASAARGGVTAIACMPNTKPICDDAGTVQLIRQQAAAAGLCAVHPVGAITQGAKSEQLADMGEMIDAGAVAFSDDGWPVNDAGLMRHAMEFSLLLDCPLKYNRYCESCL